MLPSTSGWPTVPLQLPQFASSSSLEGSVGGGDADPDVDSEPSGECAFIASELSGVASTRATISSVSMKVNVMGADWAALAGVAVQPSGPVLRFPFS